MGSQVLANHISWADFNLGSATISIDCDDSQVVIPADTVKAAVISSSNGNDLLKVRLELSTPLSVEGEDASLLELKFSLGSSATVAVSTVLHQLLGQRLQIEQRLRSSRSGSIRLPGGAAAQLAASDDYQPHQEMTGADINKSLESREISRNTDLARSLSLEKIEFSFSFSSPFSRF